MKETEKYSEDERRRKTVFGGLSIFGKRGRILVDVVKVARVSTGDFRYFPTYSFSVGVSTMSYEKSS